MYFLGYPLSYKGYKVYDLNTSKTFISRDVQFNEHIFPFKHVPDTSSSTDVSSHISDDSVDPIIPLCRPVTHSSSPTQVDHEISPDVTTPSLSPPTTPTLSPLGTDSPLAQLRRSTRDPSIPAKLK